MMIKQGLRLVPLKSCKSLSTDCDRVTYKVVSEDKLGAYSLFEITVPPQAGLPTHPPHWEEEAYYILEGELLVQEGDNTFLATAGSFIDVSSGIPHTFKNTGIVTTRLLAIITPAWCGKFFEEWVCQRQKSSCHLRLLRKTSRS